MATAATFAIALLCGVVAISGALPSSFKFGDLITIEIENAKQEGKVQGAQNAADVARSSRPDQAINEITAEAPDFTRDRLRVALESVKATAQTTPYRLPQADLLQADLLKWYQSYQKSLQATGDATVVGQSSTSTPHEVPQ